MITESQIFLTRQCNLNCGYCKLPERKLKELNFEEWKQVFLNLEKLGIKTVKILGGEPTVKQWLPDLLKFINFNTNIKTALLSNSMFDDAMLERLSQYLYGYYASVDCIEGKTNKGDPIIKSNSGYKMLNKMKKRGVPLLAANVVINKFNLFNIPKIVKQLSDEGYYVNLCTVQTTDNKEKEFSRYNINKKYVFKYSDLSDIIFVSYMLLEMKAKGYKISVPKEYIQSMYIFGINSNWKCDDIYQLRIDADGGMMLCNEYRTNLADKYNVLHMDKDKYKEFLNEWFVERNRINCDGCYWSCFIQAKHNIANNREEFHFFEENCEENQSI